MSGASQIDLGMPTVGDRSVLLAAPRGYCAGVDRAVITVEKALDLYGPPVYVRKQIVHNKHVVHDLENRGAVFVEELDEVPEGSIVVFSAHGVSPMVHEDAAERGLKTIDATCPLVTKVHHEARRFADDDYDILLIGHEGHEEVEGTAGEAPANIRLVQSPDDVAGVEVRDPNKVAWLSQTTLSVDETMETVDRIRQQFPNLLDPPSDDICYATQNRQQAVKEIAKGADLVLVVGSGNSSNSVRLVEVALGRRRQGGVPGRRRIRRSTRPGSTASSRWESLPGPRCPEDLVDGVLDFLTERGYPAAKAVHTAEESLIFALPPELRRDMKAAEAGSAGVVDRVRTCRADPCRQLSQGDAVAGDECSGVRREAGREDLAEASDVGERRGRQQRDDGDQSAEQQRRQHASGEQVLAAYGHRADQADHHEPQVEEHRHSAGEGEIDAGRPAPRPQPTATIRPRPGTPG